jgi:3-oxoadipate enol-lactonase
MNASASPLHCVIHGSGPDVVLLHPAGLDHTAMQALADSLAASHRVLNVDLRGHGESPDAPAGTRLEDFAADIAQLILSQGKGPAIVLGISLGGMLAQELALRRPDLVAGLVLCACTATFDDAIRPLLRDRGGAALVGGMAAVVESTLDRWFSAAAREERGAAMLRERLLLDRPSNWCVTWDAIASHDTLSRLAEITAPTIVIAGEKDAATPLAATRVLADAIPGARWLSLPEAPHMMQIECADAFNGVVAAFLENLGTTLDVEIAKQ